MIWSFITIIVTVFLLLAVGLLFWSFVSHERRAGMRDQLPRLSGRRRIRCHICGYVYEEVPVHGLSQCPVCGSFNKTFSAPEPSEQEPTQPAANQRDRNFEKTA